MRYNCTPPCNHDLIPLLHAAIIPQAFIDLTLKAIHCHKMGDDWIVVTWYNKRQNRRLPKTVGKE